MKAILIDPKNKTISEVEYNGDFREIYKHIECETFDIVRIEDNNTIFVDDEGLLNDPQYFFRYRGIHNPLANKGLILGTNEEGDSIATTLSVDYVKERIQFLELTLLGFEPIPAGTVTRKDHPMGEGITVIGHTPVFAPREKPEDK